MNKLERFEDIYKTEQLFKIQISYILPENKYTFNHFTQHYIHLHPSSFNIKTSLKNENLPRLVLTIHHIHDHTTTVNILAYNKEGDLQALSSGFPSLNIHLPSSFDIFNTNNIILEINKHITRETRPLLLPNFHSFIYIQTEYL